MKATAWIGLSVTIQNANRLFAAAYNRCALPRCDITPTSDLWFNFECIAYYTDTSLAHEDFSGTLQR